MAKILRSITSPVGKKPTTEVKPAQHQFIDQGDRPKVDQGDKSPTQKIPNPKELFILNKHLSLKKRIRNVDQERSDARNKKK